MLRQAPQAPAPRCRAIPPLAKYLAPCLVLLGCSGAQKAPESTQDAGLAAGTAENGAWGTETSSQNDPLPERVRLRQENEQLRRANDQLRRELAEARRPEACQPAPVVADDPHSAASERNLPVVKLSPDSAAARTSAMNPRGPRPVVSAEGSARAAVQNLPDEPEEAGPQPFTVTGDAIPRLYDQAAAAYEAGSYRAAIASCTEFMRLYPRHPYVDNALFLRAEARLAVGDSAGAERDLEQLTSEYPEDSKAPAALLRLGQLYHARGEHERARLAFQALVDHHPGSAAEDEIPSEYLP